ncbi:sensor histidine kinase [Corynebacterium sp. sy017]|uniref:sensor histidine kinase n=1 Tax=unclassified Corynebacterium TaxID=2624378 RepID=UPI001184B73B|nr:MULTISPECIES: histidine kinase [unclassified Corynebacterium]MBP3089146.1 sensor histidine kinase [Corynebacterium sp. sy017]TSD91458.1 sensor histidine kinase [Corynebacterium sp. SY003]
MLRLFNRLLDRRLSNVDGRGTYSAEKTQAERIAELTASRRKIADAYERERQRIERDLHDGAQQYLVAAAIKLGEASLDAQGESAQLIEAAKNDIHHGLAALRETVRGIPPHILRDRGLVAAISEAASKYGNHIHVYAPHPLPVLSPSVLAAGYFFATEALTNAAKYAPNKRVSVLITTDQDLKISVVDEGSGGARIIPGRGIHGLAERLDSFGGTLTLNSPSGGPTQIIGTIPLLLERGQSAISSFTPHMDT